MFASVDESAVGALQGLQKSWVPTFDQLLATTDFVKDMREILHMLQEAYEHPVDIEFTLNFVEDHTYKVHIVQCRPLPVHGIEAPRLSAAAVSQADTVLQATGAVIGHSRHIRVDQLVYVAPSAYARLPIQDRCEVARLIGRINHASAATQAGATMLLGPGRWGTSDPFLGIPVAFAEISRAAVLCEIVAMHEHLMPDVSLGTHFLNELVETDMLYLALFPQRENNYLNTEWLESSPNRLLEVVPKADRWVNTIRLIGVARASAETGSIFLDADPFEQKVICYFKR
jgi:pyruvate,water dikinase